MEALNEYKYRIVEEIESSKNKSLPQISLLMLDKKHKEGMQEALDFLEQENYLTKEEINGCIFYTIKDSNKSFAVVRVICPKCKTVRSIYNPNQVMATCKNPDCFNKGGSRTHICLRRTITSYDMSKFLHVYNG